jgi:hypothetical protein
VLLSYIASLASLLWRNRTKLKVGTGPTIPVAAPRGVVQIILVIATLIVLATGWLLLFGGSALTVLVENDSSTVWTALAVLVLLVVLGGLVDETTMSLHPFYRRRLASAFAVRAVRIKGNHVVAEPYGHSERTTLSTYGQLANSARKKFPQVIFAASATLGDRRTPPGSNRVSYTFSGNWVGGPDIGYVRTAKLQECASQRLQRDLTVQGAVALSGAALAASAGAQNSKWYETLFAVTGVRLGAWMPNPLFVLDNWGGNHEWFTPEIPKVRRLSYLLRELIGIHPSNGPLLQVTDGGFYDNLGLLELFRRKCTQIYCIDASGDSPPPATTLARVLTLAYQELGVTVELDGTAFDNTPGTGLPEKPQDALTTLNPRLAKSGIITGKISYPAESGLPSGRRRQGLLVVAKASLWPGLPYPLLAYATNNPTFPNDSTADQWFDDGQYAAYTSLGRELGRAAYEEMQKLAGSNAPIHSPAKNLPDDTGAQRKGSIRARDRSGARRLYLRHKQPTAGS